MKYTIRYEHYGVTHYLGTDDGGTALITAQLLSEENREEVKVLEGTTLRARYLRGINMAPQEPKR